MISVNKYYNLFLYFINHKDTMADDDFKK